MSTRAHRLTAEINKVIDYHCTEYDLAYSELVGVLSLILFNLMHEAYDISGEDE